ncbi:hypothetical protein ACVUJB_005456, partial [Klebsiella pneumoniae]
DSMKIGSGPSQATLIGNMANNIQLEQTIASAQSSPGITEDKFNRMSDQSQHMMSNIQRRLSEDPRYGPEAAAEYPQFVGSLPGNLSETESSDRAKEFLDKHRKS